MGEWLSADEFTFQYPTADSPALRDVSFTVSQGEVLGLVGPVEAGKTSLAMAIAGFVPEITGGWTAGDLSIAGRDPRKADDNKVAMVFEDYASQLTQLRLIDEVIAPLTNAGANRAEATDRARELLETVRLDDEPEGKFTWELSGGQQQRLALAAALAIDPEVLVFDTATDMLDPQGRSDVADLIASLAGEKTLVVAENDPDALVGIADKLLVLDAGETVAFGPAEEHLRDPELFDRIGVRPPVCLEVARRLGFEGRPIDIGEFSDRYQARFGGEPPKAGLSETMREPRDAEWSEGEPVIRAEAAGFQYPDGTVAVDDIDLSIHPGEIHAIIGGNGAGKSTLSNLLVGLMRPDEGTVKVDGTDTREVAPEWLAETVGIALQNPDEQISRRTVDEEIAYALRVRQVSKSGPFGIFGRTERYDDAYIEARVDQVCELVGIEESIRDLDPVFLPRGQRRLVTIAAALAPDPVAIVLDEPGAGVDSAGQAVIADAIESLAGTGTAVVIVEHDMEFVCEVADRVTVLQDGRIAMQGPTQEVFNWQNWEWLAERHMRAPKPARLGRRVGAEALTSDALVGELAARLEVAS